MSEKVEWFALLPYSNIELLIPKSVIEKTFYFNKEEFPLSKENFNIFSVEDLFFVPQIFDGFTYETSTSRTGFLINSEKKFIIITKVIPKMISFSSAEFKQIPGKFGESLAKKGISGFRFADDRIQILLDIINITGN